MEPQSLFDRRLEPRHLAECLIAQLLVGSSGQLGLLGEHGVELLRVPQKLDEGPRGGSRRGVVPGEHHRDEHAGHDVRR